MQNNKFRVMVYDLARRTGKLRFIDEPETCLGGSGLAARLFTMFGKPGEPFDHPDQPLIFAIGPLTGYFPLMSKTVMAFVSPYNGQYTESHAGGRLALAMRFAGYDALVITGRAERPCCLIAGTRALDQVDVHYLWGMNVFTTGKHLRKVYKRGSGSRSMLRIGPAGENGCAFAAINVDTYRHFGRLGCGTAMGVKKLKAVIVQGDGSLDLPEGKEYRDLYKHFYEQMTGTEAMRKYHDLGTPINVNVLNEISALPWRNMQQTSSKDAGKISGEKFAMDLLLRKAACSGCPVGCVHVGLLREQFAEEHEFVYRQVSYDHEPIFAAGAMLELTRPEQVLSLLEDMDSAGLDVISAGVCLAWATEALDTGVISEKQTLTPLKFGDLDGYRVAVGHLARQTNEFYKALARGTMHAAKKYGGEDFACVLGQEMAGYATGETFYVSQAYGFRHSHLDSAGYSYDQKAKERSVKDALNFMLDEEKTRVMLTCMVSCLFARSVYKLESMQQALSVLGLNDMAQALPRAADEVRKMRWKLKFETGYDPGQIKIPKRFRRTVTWKGELDQDFMDRLAREYAQAVRNLAD